MLIERVKRGYYETTELGEQYLAGDVNLDDF